MRAHRLSAPNAAGRFQVWRRSRSGYLHGVREHAVAFTDVDRSRCCLCGDPSLRVVGTRGYCKLHRADADRDWLESVKSGQWS